MEGTSISSPVTAGIIGEVDSVLHARGQSKLGFLNPSYEPHSKIYGVPLNGAPPPGPSAANDTSGSNVENSVDLEMIGSTAPGSSIYNVYGLSPTNTTIDDSCSNR